MEKWQVIVMACAVAALVLLNSHYRRSNRRRKITNMLYALEFSSQEELLDAMKKIGVMGKEEYFPNLNLHIFSRKFGIRNRRLALGTIGSILHASSHCQRDVAWWVVNEYKTHAERKDAVEEICSRHPSLISYLLNEIEEVVKEENDTDRRVKIWNGIKAAGGDPMAKTPEEANL